MLLETISRPRFKPGMFRLQSINNKKYTKTAGHSFVHIAEKSESNLERTNKQINYPIKDSTFRAFIIQFQLPPFHKYVAAGGWRKQPNEELRNFYSSPNNITMIKSRWMR